MSETTIPAGFTRRREDYGLITGRASYVDDLKAPAGCPPALYMAMVRSPYAHAQIEQIDLDAALSLPGVAAAFTGAELVGGMPTLESVPLPGLKKPERRLMAIDRVRYVGDPVAVVLAESFYLAGDARELVEVDYSPLPPVIDPEEALSPGAPLLYDEFGSNIAFQSRSDGGDIAAAFEHADRVVKLRLVNQRLAPSSIEPRVCMFDFDPATGVLSAWMSSQSIFRARETLAYFLKLDRSRVQIQNAEVGGAFGAKNALLGEEIVAAALAVRFGRPVKWVETRGENLQGQIHGRGQVNYVEAAVSSDGRLLGLKVRIIADLGAFLANVTAMVPNRTPFFLSGPYTLAAIESEVVGVFTNKVPTAPYRGAGRPEAAYIVERVMDALARELNLDPAEARRRNFIPPNAFPYKTATGALYDSGNYQAALDRALELADYQGWRAKQAELRAARGQKLLGIGLATFIEQSGDATIAPGPKEAVTVRVRRDGTIVVQSGVSTNGQGQLTAFAQIAASVFHLPGSKVEVYLNDTALPAFSIGTFASRVTQTGGSAVLLAAEAARQKALNVAARVLEVSPADLELEDGRASVRGAPSRSVELGELARLVEEQPDLIEHEPPNPVNGAPIEGLAAWRDYTPEGASYGSGAHIAVVEIDRESGEIELLQYVAVDDCGRVLNHYLAGGQIHGSLAQGIGQALYEGILYDEDGQLLTGTLMDYALPLAKQLPTFLTDFIETPSPLNPSGVKGVGEAGCIGAPPAIVNAALDALAPLGITSIDMPLTPEKLWKLMMIINNQNR